MQTASMHFNETVLRQKKEKSIAVQPGRGVKKRPCVGSTPRISVLTRQIWFAQVAMRLLI